MNKKNNMPVWRHMSFAKFIWLIQNKSLWLSRTDGVRLDFDFEHLIESVRIHPEADKSIFDAVQNIVTTYTPDFTGNVAWLDMKMVPPL